jgi:hypothetical protein
MNRRHKQIRRAIGLAFGLVVIGSLSWRLSGDKPQPIDSRWQKLDKDGLPMAVWAGPWACVLDNNTGLIWENKLDDESIHDGYWTYSWYSDSNKVPEGVENMGDCYFESSRCDTQDLIRRANQQKTCGIDSWRLPTVAELNTLVKLDGRPGSATIATDFFPKTHRGDYWTKQSGVQLSVPFKHLSPGSYAINFGTGQVYGLPHRNAAFVRLVSEFTQAN